MNRQAESTGVTFMEIPAVPVTLKPLSGRWPTTEASPLRSFRANEPEAAGSEPHCIPVLSDVSAGTDRSRSGWNFQETTIP
jgi:hypothetical protein